MSLIKGKGSIFPPQKWLDKILQKQTTKIISEVMIHEVCTAVTRCIPGILDVMSSKLYILKKA
jgi:hypothetical protein